MGAQIGIHFKCESRRISQIRNKEYLRFRDSRAYEPTETTESCNDCMAVGIENDTNTDPILQVMQTERFAVLNVDQEQPPADELAVTDEQITELKPATQPRARR